MKEMKFILITGSAEIAAYAHASGVNRLMVDLEWMGKADRQGHVDTWKSGQTPADVSAVRAAVPDAELMVRVNPLHAGTKAEIEDALARGADVLMLPMFRDTDAVARFSDIVAARAGIMPLVETLDAVQAVPDILRKVAPQSLYFGLNDLRLDMKADFLFRPLVDGALDAAAMATRAARVPFGVGGLARPDEGVVPPELVLGEHVRLGSEWGILSRTFHRMATSVAELEETLDFAGDIASLRQTYRRLQDATDAELNRNRAEIVARIDAHIVDAE